MATCGVAMVLMLAFCIVTSTAQTEGFTEHPMSMSVDRGQQVTLSCTYRSNQGPATITWVVPAGVTPTNTAIDGNTIQSSITFTAASSSFARDYHCTATAVDGSQTDSNVATLTVNYYAVQFEEPLYTVHESFDTFNVFVETRVTGSPTRSAVVSFTRDDSGPAINDLTVSTEGSQALEARIPNDMVRTGDRVFHVTLSTSDNLIEFAIGSLTEVAIDVTEDDLDATVTPSVARVTTGNDVVLMATDFVDASYEWFHNSVFIFNRPDKYSGEFTSSLTIMNAQESDEGTYRSSIILGGAFAEPTAQLFVFDPVSITSHPANVTLLETESATFSVEATGDNLTYQWQRDGVSLVEMAGRLEGVNTPTLRVLDARASDEGRYSCVVTNGAGDGETSNVAFLTVTVDNTADVFFELRGEVYPNNSAITITDIGERSMALFCVTNRVGCCRTPPNRAGRFYFPNGDQVRNRRVSQLGGQGLYRTRRTQHIRLHRRPGINTPTGVYRCEIPDASGVTQKIFINLTV